MKKIVLVFCLAFLSKFSIGQQAFYSWHQQIDGGGYDEVSHLAVLSNGDVISLGQFSGVQDFDPDPVVSQLIDASHGYNFICRLSSTGTYRWAVAFDSSATLNIASMSRDVSDDIYICGSFNGKADMEPGPGTTFIQSLPNSIDVFFAKYSGVDGHLICAKTFGSTQQDYLTGICGDSHGNIFISGNYFVPLNVDPNGSFVITPFGGNDIYLAKYDSMGNFIQAINFGASGGDNAGQILADDQDHIYTCGTLSDSTDLDPGTSSFILSASTFILKLDDNFNFIKAVGFTGNGGATPRRFIMDSSYNLVMAGAFRSNLGFDFDGGPDTASLVSTYLGDSFICIQDSALNYISAIDIPATTVAQPWGLSADSGGNVYVSFYYQDNVDVDPGAGVVSYTAQNSSSDILLVKYSSALQLLWSYSMGNIDWDFGMDIAAGENGKFYASGYFRMAMDVDPGSGQVILDNHTAQSSDGYLICYNQCQPLTNSVNATLCNGQQYIFDQDTLTTSGTYVKNFSSVAFCDSIVTLNLTVNSPVIELCMMDTILKSKAINASYQWINCATNSPVNGATAQSFQVPDNNPYSVQVTQNGCVDTSACLQVYANANRRLPEFVWGNVLPYEQFGGTHMMQIGKDGDIYLGGDITSLANFNLLGGPDYTLEGINGHQYFCLAKYDGNREFKWAFACGSPVSTGPYPEVSVTSMTLDSIDNIYIAGSYATAFDCDPGPGTYILPDNNLTYSFVAKYNSSGQFLWADYIELSGGGMEINALFTDKSGHVYVGGEANGPLTIVSATTSAPLTAFGLHAPFLFQLNATNGNYVWSLVPGVSAFGDCAVSNGTCDVEGNIIVTGHFNESIDVDPGPATVQLSPYLSGTPDAFLLKFKPDQTLLWAKKRNSICDFTNAGTAYNVVTDCDTNIYWLGACLGAYLAKYSSSGVYLGDLMNSGVQTTSHDLVMDEANNMYLLVSFHDSCIIGSDTLYNNSYGDVVFCKFRKDGRFDWSAQLMNPEKEDQPISIDVDREGNIYVLGNFNDTIDVDAGSNVYNLTAPSGFHLFLTKYGETCAPVDTALVGDSTLLMAHDTSSWYQWIDCNTGQILPNANQSSIQPLNAGYYRAIIYQGECVDTSGCYYMAAFNSIAEKGDFNIGLWPNPVGNGQMEIVSDRPLSRIELFSSNGTKVYDQTCTDRKSKQQISTANYAEGLYILKVSCADGSAARKKVMILN